MFGYDNHFKELGINYYSHRHQLHTVGYVDDVEQHAEIYGVEKRRKEIDWPSNILGMYVGQNYGFFQDVKNLVHADHYIFYKKTKSETLDTFVRAHEETHALHSMGGLSKLEDLLKDNGVDMELAEYKDFDRYEGSEGTEIKEKIAHFGGFYVLEKKNVDLNTFVDGLENQGQNIPYLREALEEYQEAKGDPRPLTPLFERVPQKPTYVPAFASLSKFWQLMQGRFSFDHWEKYLSPQTEKEYS